MTLSSEDLRKRAEADDLLYEKFARHLEAEHSGEFAAIAQDGRLILGKDDLEILEKAIQEFGSGNFAFRKIGSKVLGRWRRFLGY